MSAGVGEAGRGNKVVGGNRRRALRGYGGARRRPLQNSQRVLPAMARGGAGAGVDARGFNTKGHKERRDGMDRNTKIFWWGEK